MTKEYPILFSAEMVRAILDGRKTVTRRVILPQPEVFDNSGIPDYSCLKQPYQKCDLLWVRETWWDLGHMENGKWDGRLKSHTVGPRYVATCTDPFTEGIGGLIQPVKIHWKETALHKSTWRKRPSIHMPKWATRIWLEILDVRAERLQEITKEDCIKEGVKLPKAPADLHDTAIAAYKCMFHILWDTLNAKRGYGWDTNLWVLRIEFKLINNN